MERRILLLQSTDDLVDDLRVLIRLLNERISDEANALDRTSPHIRLCVTVAPHEVLGAATVEPVGEQYVARALK